MMNNDEAFMIILKNINKYYYLGKSSIHALKNISIEIDKGDFISIIGPSGSGKTTLLNIIGFLDKQSDGEYIFDNKNINFYNTDKLAELRAEKIGFVFQNFNLIPVLNIFENIETSIILSNKKDLIKNRKKIINKVIEEVGLTEFIKHKPFELSGGQRQRVAIARALAKKPEIIIADEPTANLDSENAFLIIKLMKMINEQEKTTFIFSTHDERLIEYTKTRIRIQDGQIIK